MKELISNVNRTKILAFLSVMVFILGFLSIMASSPSNYFLQVWDMGNSATSLAISRTLLNPPPNAPDDLFGYIQNGELTNYLHWPKGGVYALISWFKIFNNDSLYVARLLAALIYAVNALMFFWLMMRCKISILASICSSVLFIVLPYHLEYGKMVYADIWLLTIWLITLHIFVANGFKNLWMIVIMTIGGSLFFMWYAIFMLPAVLLLYFKDKWRLSVSQLLVTFCSLVIVTWFLQYIVFSNFEDAYFLNALKPWTIFRTGMELEIGSWEFIRQVVKRIVTIGYEFFPVLTFILLSLKWVSIADLKKVKHDNQLLIVLAILTMTLLLNICVLPFWYVLHPFSIAFFAILIAGSSALLLEYFRYRLDKKRVMLLGGSMILCSILLFLCYPSFSETYKNIPPKVTQIVKFIQTKDDGEKRLCTFINTPNLKGWPHAFRFGIKEQTNTYLFFNDSIGSIDSLSDYFKKGMSDLEHLGVNDFDKEKVIFITDSLCGSHLPALDSISVNEICVYEFKL